MCFSYFLADAQLLAPRDFSYSNLRAKIFPTVRDTMKIDTSSIFPGTLVIRDMKTNEIIPKENYKLDYANGKLFFTSPKPDSVLITYRSFPIHLATVVQHKSRNIIRKGDSAFYESYYYQPLSVESASFLDFGGLNYSGNFARGIQFGSNQDLTLNSTLDLRLSGKIANGIEITAALTDNNIPLQPDGTTQQLQDFDKVYIQLKKDPHIIIAGDYNLKSFDSYFMRFSKQLQGASYANNLVFKKGIRLQTSTSLAVSRGKFTRNIFQGSEGNQGPYRLTGSNNESFIIVLAGSEKVYVDGVRLQRGELLDYVMDYNSGEVLFMPRFLITKDSRIVVEFEYSDKNYFRTTVHEGINFNYKKLNIFTQVYSEQDAKNKPITNSLSDSTKLYLSTIGNDISNAYISGVHETTFDPNRVQYRKVDSTINSVTYDSVFVYETNPDSGKFSLSFSYLGQNKGNYIPTKNPNNVRVYQWIEPLNGIPQGSYEPVTLIVTPKSQLLFTFGIGYQINDKMKIRTEMAFSNYDRNLFSSVGNKENKGYAANLQVSRVDSFKHNLVFTNAVDYEFKDRRFTQIEPYRNVEFSRDWNITNEANLTEHIARYMTGLFDIKHKIQVGYQFSTFIRQQKYQGYENRLNFANEFKGLRIIMEARVLNTRDSLYKSIFFRPLVNVIYSIAKVRGLGFGVGFFQENNIFKTKSTNVLQQNSFRNNNLSAQFFLPDTAKWSFMLEYKYRKDIEVVNGSFKDSTIAHTLDFHGTANQIKNQTFNWTFTFRDLVVKDTTIQAQSEKTYLGRTEYGARIKKGVLRLNFIYELGGGREKVRQFTYIQVPSGQGYYKWIDQNQNSIPELNEFVPSQFNDSAQYVRVLTDLNEYVRSNSTAYTQNITIQPKAIWFNEKGFKNFMSKLTFQSYLQIKRKTYKSNALRSFNPFIFRTSDSNTITLNSNIRNTFIFNSGDPIYSFSFTNQLVNDKVLLINGFDTRKRMDNILEGYYNLNTMFTLNMKFIQSRLSLISDYFHPNDYNIHGYYLEPKFTYNFKTSLRTSVSYGFTEKKNRSDLGGERTIANKMELELRYNKAAKNTLETKFTLAVVKFTGENGTTKSYTILEGLQPGKNYLWSASYTRNISQNLELSLTYEGRKTGTAKLINTGRAQLRAVF
ncbi:MAG: hypothetical protein JWN78_290 [Bacteroidota bacterium]|nr:hypothetical protein [Bacteroidota bacterium]